MSVRVLSFGVSLIQLIKMSMEYWITLSLPPDGLFSHIDSIKLCIIAYNLAKLLKCDK